LYNKLNNNMASIKVFIKEEEEFVIKGVPKVPMSESKKLVSPDGSISIYYIKREYAWKHKLDSKINFNNPHPMDENYCEITIPIERI